MHPRSTTTVRRQVRRLRLLPLALILVSSILTVSSDGVSASTVPVNHQTPAIFTGIEHPDDIALGSDGAMWFTSPGFTGSGNAIGRITTSGAVTIYRGGGAIDDPDGITAGPDGALWFTNNTGYDRGSIGRITTSGVVTSFTGNGIAGPNAITTGSDGALWFTNEGDGSIGRITTDGSVSIFTAPGIDQPSGIAAGSDGALWFINAFNNAIGRITTTGAVSFYSGSGISQPNSITAGPDGALWFTNDNNSIGRITTAGVARFHRPRAFPDPPLSLPAQTARCGFATGTRSAYHDVGNGLYVPGRRFQLAHGRARTGPCGSLASGPLLRTTPTPARLVG